MATTTRTKKNEAYQDMYICLKDAHEKKKYVLQGIKNSLIMQEEYEKIIELRKNKTLVSKEIKTQMTKINTLYQDLKKQLPNVKGVLNYTEKELTELEGQISSLKGTIESDKTTLKVSKDIKKNIHNTTESIRNIEEKREEVITQENKKPQMKRSKQKSLSKLERIKNNLKVIESKIKDI